MRDLAPILTEHLYDLRARNRAERSIDNRRYNLNLFADWCTSAEHPPATVADVGREHVTRYLAERAETEAPETVLTRFRHLRAFFRWCEREEIVERSPLVNLSEPRAEQQPPPVLTPEQLRAVFDGCRGKSFSDRRDLAMFAFMADTGCRVGELVALETDDLDFTHSTAQVVGKFGRRRIVAFGPKCGKVLLAYLRVRATHRCADDPRLWVGARGPLREAAVWRIVRDRGARAGVDDLHPHVLRHTFAHRFRAAGGAEGDLAMLGGWRSPAMLARYGASAAAERAVEAHRRVDPLGDVL